MNEIRRWIPSESRTVKRVLPFAGIIAYVNIRYIGFASVSIEEDRIFKYQKGKGHSMSPTLESGDRFVVSKRKARSKSTHATGTVVLLEDPTKYGGKLIKRIRGVVFLHFHRTL